MRSPRRHKQRRPVNVARTRTRGRRPSARGLGAKSASRPFPAWGRRKARSLRLSSGVTRSGSNIVIRKAACGISMSGRGAGVGGFRQARAARALRRPDAGDRAALLGRRPHDAEDAYQRAAEILLTARSARHGRRAVPLAANDVKHEALAIRRQRERVVPPGGPDAGPRAAAAPARRPEERAERLERLRLGAQAMRSAQAAGGPLPGAARRGLQLQRDLRADRLVLHEGQPLPHGGPAGVRGAGGRDRVGRECERLAPALSALADGEASAEDLAAARPHLRACLACRAKLREYRAVPSRVAALLPPMRRGAPGRSAARCARCSSPSRHVRTGAGWATGHAAELATGQKVAAVAASAAVVAGGGASVKKLAVADHPPIGRTAPPSASPCNHRPHRSPTRRHPSRRRRSPHSLRPFRSHPRNPLHSHPRTRRSSSRRAPRGRTHAPAGARRWRRRVRPVVGS